MVPALLGIFVLAASPDFNSLKAGKLAGDLQVTEGPVWIPGAPSPVSGPRSRRGEEGRLLFSDIPGNKMHSVYWQGPADNEKAEWKPEFGIWILETFRDPSGNANGNTLDRQGRLVSCEHGNRRVSRTEADGSVVTLADKFDGKRLNSPNDVVVSKKGLIYFTDPPYGIDLKQQELPFQGLFLLRPETSDLKVLCDDFDRPNGLAFSPDEKRLYVSDSSDRRQVRVFDIDEWGELKDPKKGKIFATLDPGGVPDGMRVDKEGKLYVAGGGGIWVFDPKGKHLGTIPCPETPTNCAFGGPEMKTLFITAQHSLYAVALPLPGLNRP